MWASSISARSWLLAALVLIGLVSTPAFAAAQLGALVSPGRLHKAHAALEGMANCLQCHSRGRQVDAGKCLSCHKPIAERAARRIGIHRAATAGCVTCHVEHAGVDAELRPFDLNKFSHVTDTAFPLDGLHAPLSANCGVCHKTRSFLTVSAACSSCHNDVHRGTLGSQCTNCHSAAVRFAAAATAGNFDHSRTKFPLAGSHARVACASCHVNKQYRGIAFGSCASCHKDPHQNRMGPACSSCHSDMSWGTTKFDHSRTAFSLRGKHAAVACAKCHLKPAAAVKPQSATCAGCHSDPHRGTFTQDCGSCHNESGFQKGTFDHATTKFPLVDKHAPLICAACHASTKATAKDFRGLSIACASCHTDPHTSELGAGCAKCHSSRSWDVQPFTHANDRSFFHGQHAPLTCSQCHASTLQPVATAAKIVARRVGFTTTAAACVSCHKDPHIGQVSQICEACHTVATPKFAVADFSHARTKFPLTGRHATAECVACHKVETASFPAGRATARRLTGIDTSCATCHQDPHRGQLGATCQSCHSTDTFALKAFTHKNERALRSFFTGRHKSASCASCHKPIVAAGRGAANYTITTACTTCHVDVHRGALGSTCETCHKP